ncbi:MAG TPA: hypothetical protein VMB47_11360 [Candidatus Aquilonibacter sp.]|nr:hypothetical protein [Candidatus Aquilonibacter sp.]
MHWLTDTLTVLLTAAIAYTGWRQLKTAEKQDETAKNLLALQKTIEEQRNQAWIFLRVIGFAQAAAERARLEISNLSEVGIWVEKITVHLAVPHGTPNRAHAVLIQKPLASMAIMPIEAISPELFGLVGAKGADAKQVTFWADVEFWAKGKFRTEPTIRYSADIDEWRIQNLRPAVS